MLTRLRTRPPPEQGPGGPAATCGDLAWVQPPQGEHHRGHMDLGHPWYQHQDGKGWN